MTPDEQLAELRAELASLQEEDRALHARMDVAAAGIAALLRHVDNGRPAVPGALTERIVELLADGRVRRPSELTEALRVVDPTVQANAIRATLSQLVAAGRLERLGRGRYGVPAP